MRTGRRESWHKGWGLPRPSLVYFQAGSVFLFKVKNPESWDEQKAYDLIEAGIGDRRAEGYGRILLNPLFCTSDNVQEADPDKKTKIKTKDGCVSTLTSEERNFIERIEREFFKKRFRNAIRCEIYSVIQVANENEKAKKDTCVFSESLWWSQRPSLNQFGALMEAATSIGGKEEDLAVIRKWVSPKDEKDPTKVRDKKSWSPQWLTWVKKLVESPRTLWKICPSAEIVKNSLPDRVWENHETETQLTHYALRTFFDILCEAVFDMEKQNKKNKNEVKSA